MADEKTTICLRSTRCQSQGLFLAFVLATVGLTSPVAADTRLDPIPAGIGPREIAVNVVTNRIYIAHEDPNGPLLVIDGDDHSTRTVSIGAPGPSARSLSVNTLTNRIYITNPGDDTVTVLNGDDHSTQTLPVGSGPSAVAVNPITNRIYVANRAGDSVTVIDGADHSTQSIPVGNGPARIAINAVTNQICVLNVSSDSVSIIDGSTLAVQSVSVGDEPKDVQVNPVLDKVYVSNGLSASVTVIDGLSLATEMVTTASFPGAMGVNLATNKIYVASSSLGGFTIIDGNDHSVEILSGFGNASAVAVNASANMAYVASPSGDKVVIINESPSGLPRLQTIPSLLGARAVAVNPITAKVYVSNDLELSGAGRIEVLDAHHFPGFYVGPQMDEAPFESVFDPSRDQIYFSHGSSSGAGSPTVTRVDQNTNQVFSIPVGANPRALALNRNTGKVYVANLDDSTVTEIDIDDSTETVAVGSEPVAIAVNLLTNRIYTANQASNTVTVIDGGILSTTSVPVGLGPSALAVDLESNRVFVAGRGSGATNSATITVIDGFDHSVITTFFNSGENVDVAINPVRNEIYVANVDACGTIWSIDGDTLVRTGLPTCGPRQIEVNPVAGQIFGLFRSSDGMTDSAWVYDLNDGSSTSLGLGAPSSDNPKITVEKSTNRLYLESGSGLFVHDRPSHSTLVRISGYGASAVCVDPEDRFVYARAEENDGFVPKLAIVFDGEDFVTQVPLRVEISDFPSDTSVTNNPVFNLQGASLGYPLASIRVFYQIDCLIGPWIEAPGSGTNRTLLSPFLSAGEHVLYAFAFSDYEAGVSGGASPAISEIAAYSFTVRDCVSGTVNLSASGAPQPVLFVNGSDGGETRTVFLSPGEPLTLDLAASASGPVTQAEYVFWTWAGDLSDAVGAPLLARSDFLGCFSKPTPLTGGSPQPLFCVRSDGFPDAVCQGTQEKPGPSGAPFSLVRSTGIGNPIKLTLQGLLQDSGSRGTLSYSVTNAVVICVE